MKYRYLLGAVVWLAVAGGVAAQGQADKAAEKTRVSNQQFAGLDFGIALTATFDIGSRDRVTDATVDANGVVRVNKQNNIPVRLMLETHYLFRPWWDSGVDAQGRVSEMTQGLGPFVAVQPGENDVIDAIGLGVLLALRRKGEGTNQSFNLGFGVIIDPSARTLGDEFKDGQPAPTDSGGAPLPIRYVERNQVGILVLASFTW